MLEYWSIGEAGIAPYRPIIPPFQHSNIPPVGYTIHADETGKLFLARTLDRNIRLKEF